MLRVAWAGLLALTLASTSGCLIVFEDDDQPPPIGGPDGGVPDAGPGPGENLLRNGDFSVRVPFESLPQSSGLDTFAQARLGTDWPAAWFNSFTMDEDGREIRVGPDSAPTGIRIESTNDPALPYGYEVNIGQAVPVPAGSYHMRLVFDGDTGGDALEICPVIDFSCGGGYVRVRGPGDDCVTYVLEQPGGPASFEIEFLSPGELTCPYPSMRLGIWAFIEPSVPQVLIYRSVEVTLAR